MTKLHHRIVSLALSVLFALSLCGNAFAARYEESVQPQASNYLNGYTAYVYSPGNGKVQVWFTVSGAGVMDELGALTVILKESTDQQNWTIAKVFRFTNTSDMLFYNRSAVSSHVECTGVAGRYYAAAVTVWGGKNGNGDSRQVTTPIAQAR